MVPPWRSAMAATILRPRPLPGVVRFCSSPVKTLKYFLAIFFGNSGSVIRNNKFSLSAWRAAGCADLCVYGRVQDGIIQQVKSQLCQQFYITGHCYVRINVCVYNFFPVHLLPDEVHRSRKPRISLRLTVWNHCDGSRIQSGKFSAWRRTYQESYQLPQWPKAIRSLYCSVDRFRVTAFSSLNFKWLIGIRRSCAMSLETCWMFSD